MEIFKQVVVVVAVLLLLAVLGGLKVFTEHCQEKFGHALFSKQSYISTMVAVAFGMLGMYCLDDASKHQGDHFWGWVGIGIAAVILMTLVAINFKNMDFACGLGGSILQLSVLIPLALLSLAILAFYLSLLLITNGASEESDEERERRQIEEDDDAWHQNKANASGPNYEESSYK